MSSKTRILIDILHIRNSLHSGIANVAVDVIKGFVKYSDWDIIILTWEGMGEAVDDIAGLHLEKIFVPVEQQIYLDKKINIKICPRFLTDIIESKKINLVFTTCYTINSYIYPKRFNQVGYVMDMQQMKIRKLRKQWVGMIYHWAYFALYLRLVNHIFCISDTTGEDISKFSGRKSTTVYISINNVFDQKDTTPINGIEGMNYILDVNSFTDYKNTERLIKAFALIKDNIPHTLYLKGYGCDDRRKQELLSLIRSLGVSERVVLDINNRTAEEMAYLFDHASLFVSPSLMEGFGLTPIEAIMHGSPAIVSNIKCLVEVTNNKVNTFDPYSIEAISNAILSTLKNPPSREEIVEIGKSYKERYSLKRQIEQYKAYFSEIIQRGS